MQHHAAEFEVSALCAALAVSRSGYYAWLTRPESARQRADQELLATIADLHRQSRGTYGSPRIQAELHAQGKACSRKRVAHLMQRAPLQGRPERKVVRTTPATPGATSVPDLLQRDFSATAPNQKWVADITYIPTQEGWLYLAVVMDLFSRLIVGWAMLPQMTADLVLLAIQMAVHRRPLPAAATVIHHSDHGSQYTSSVVQALLAQYHIQVSMGSTGDCYDNTAMESFFATLKRECVQRQPFTSRAMARTVIFEFIEVFYNRQRRHSTLGYLSPWDFEQLYQHT
ncbi:MAG: IS3 family transposase [Anaerolineae bacterium]|nr:IS3 family transposase [Anaerolineae bacterium]